MKRGLIGVGVVWGALLWSACGSDSGSGEPAVDESGGSGGTEAGSGGNQAGSGGTQGGSAGSGGNGAVGSGGISGSGAKAGSAGAGGSTAGGGNGASGGQGAAAGTSSSGGAMAGSSGSGAGGSGGGFAFVALVDADFEGRAEGQYTRDMVEGDFGVAAPWDNGLDEGRATIVSEGGNEFLRVTYPAGGVGPGSAGVQFEVALGQSYDELYLSYRLRFGADFEWVKGGKLPGFIGGTGPTGCVQDDTGFSARMMWRGAAALVQYMYYPNKQSNCGDDFHYETGGMNLAAPSGEWLTVQHRLVMNTPGQQDGVLQGWVDGELMLDLHDFEYRLQGASYAIDGMYFSTFYGGSTDDWAPMTDQTIDFDDFIIAEKPIVAAP